MELFVKLGLKEIASIINRMGLTTDIDHFYADGIEVNGVQYSYEKNGNELVVSDSLGNKTKIRIDYREEQGKDAYNRDVTYIKHLVGIDYLLKNGNMIHFEKNIGLDPGYESFENVRRHDLLKELRTKYCNQNGEEIASFNLSLDEICLKEDNQMYLFRDEGIVCGNKIITLDGNTLVSISGNEIPPKDIVDTFFLNEEQEKINRIIDENKDIHPFTIEALHDASRTLDRKERFVRQIVNYYDEDINRVRKAIDIRNALMDSIENSITDYNGLEAVANDYYFKTLENRKVLKKQ